YRLKMIDSDNTVSYSKTVVLKTPRCASAISVQSNPVRNTLHLKTTNIGGEYRIYSATGALLKTDRIRGTSQSVDVSRFPTGLYCVTVTGAEPIMFVKE